VGCIMRMISFPSALAIATLVAGFGAGPAVGQVGSAPPPYELTSRGNIAHVATLAYKSAIESCYPETAGSAPRGPQFVACLKQRLRQEAASLDKAYAATVGLLRTSPNKISRLRQAQRAWQEFQSANCAFAQGVAPGSEAAEFLLDCQLRSTIDRRVELRSLVGD
jgi:uncharacterized protein YecT (DUF1311 family)